MNTRKINKLKLFVSGLILSLALGVVDYDVLFLSNYDYSCCENKENTELVVSADSKIEFLSKNQFYLEKSKIDFEEKNRFLIYKLSLQLYNTEMVQLFNSQNQKAIIYENSNLKNFLSNSVYTSDEYHQLLLTA